VESLLNRTNVLRIGEGGVKKWQLSANINSRLWAFSDHPGFLHLF